MIFLRRLFTTQNGMNHSFKQNKINKSFISYTNINNLLVNIVIKFPYKEAVRYIKQKEKWSYLDVQNYTNNLSNGLLGMDFIPGDTLVTWMPNSAENLITQLAASRIGVRIVSIDSSIRHIDELSYILKDSNAKGIFYEPKLNGLNCSDMIQKMLPELEMYEKRKQIFRASDYRHLQFVVTTGHYDRPGVSQFRGLFLKDLEPFYIKKALEKVHLNTPAAVTYAASADLTTPIKSYEMTHQDIIKAAIQLNESLNITTDDKICLKKFTSGYMLPFLAIGIKNAQLIIPSKEFNDKDYDYAKSIEEWKHTLIENKIDNS